MTNKVLISLIVPSVLGNYDIYIPINERLDKILTLIIKGLQDLNDIDFKEKSPILINSSNGKVYSNTDIIRNTDIRNGSKLILIFDQN